MTTLTKHPAKTVKVRKTGKEAEVIYWKGKPMPAIFFEDPEPVEDGMLQQDTITKFAEALKRRYPDDFVKDGGFVMYDPRERQQALRGGLLHIVRRDARPRSDRVGAFQLLGLGC